MYLPILPSGASNVTEFEDWTPTPSQVALSLAWCTPMLLKQNGALLSAPSKTSWQFRHLLLLWREEVPATQLNEAEPRLEAQPLTVQPSPLATELCLSGGGKPGV